MREIKFRFWEPYDGGRMVSDHDGWYEGVGINEAIQASVEDYDYKIMQYTGLKDDEDVEIYEGDIIEGSYGIPGRGIKGVVEYEGSAFIVKTPGHTPDQTTLKMLIEYIGQVWVIGNIYENSELLS